MDIKNKEPLNSTDLLISEDPTTKFGLLAAKIAYYNFEWRFITLVMFNTVQAIGLQTFLKHYNQSVIVKLGRFLPEHRVAVPQFVIFGEDSSEISSTIRWLVKVEYDSNAKFIIICASYSHECDEGKIFQTLLKNLVLNVIVIKASGSNNRPFFYTYHIVSPNKCLDEQIHEIDLFTNCHNDKCYERLFPERLSNFYRCRLRVSTIEQPPFMYLYNGTRTPSGTDGDILTLAADMLNATLILKTPSEASDWGHYANNNWTGSLGDIYNNLAQVSACSAPLTANKYGNFQISFTYYSMDIVWAAKLPTEKAPWEKLLYPLKIHVRVILLLTFIGIVVMNTLKDTNMWRKVKKTFQMGPLKYNMLFYSWLLFLGMPILRMPRKRSFLITTYTWIWFCFIVRSAYQAGLINSLKHPAYLDKLKTFGEVLRDGYPFGGPPSIREYYYDDRDIYDKWIHVDLNDISKTLDEILDGNTDFVIASNREIIKHHVLKYNGTKHLQIIPQKIVNSPTVVYFKKFSPAAAPMSYVLRVAFEAGFVQRSYGRYLDHDRHFFRQKNLPRPGSLNLYNFAGCFAILIIGWILSSIYFAVEYICGNLEDDNLTDD